MSLMLSKSVYGNTYVEFGTSVRGVGLKPGDLITITYAREGFDWATVQDCQNLTRREFPHSNNYRADSRRCVVCRWLRSGFRPWDAA